MLTFDKKITEVIFNNFKVFKGNITYYNETKSEDQRNKWVRISILED